jgi:O-acetyl-ADP-ribose deacetylase (regulator of RNase III)
MIKISHGNLLQAKVDAIVNTVNCVGVMGKGIALQFKKEFPENFRLYERACKANQLKPGQMFVTQNPDMFGAKWIVNFPTKMDWRNPSKLDWIVSGLVDLANFVKTNGVRSIAIPALGCSNGGLNWTQVRPLIEQTFADETFADTIVYLYPPQGN